MIDTHAHIEELADIEQALKRAKTKGLAAIVAVGSSPKANMKTLALTREYSGFIYPAVGIHPSEADGNLNEAVRFISDNASKCVAIGEVGLDYQITTDKSRQKEVLENMLEIAKRCDKPVSLHSRGAWDDVFSCVQYCGIRKSVFHWYSGPLGTLKRIVDNGYFISATPAVEYSLRHREAIQKAPVEAILLETDAPVRYHGVPSEPSDVAKVLDIVAKLKGISPSQLADVTTGNACKIFGISH